MVFASLLIIGFRLSITSYSIIGGRPYPEILLAFVSTTALELIVPTIPLELGIFS